MAAKSSWRSRCSAGCAGLVLLGGMATARDAVASALDAAPSPPPDAATNAWGEVAPDAEANPADVIASADATASAPDDATNAWDDAANAPDAATGAPDIAVSAPDVAMSLPGVAVDAPDVAVSAPDAAPAPQNATAPQTAPASAPAAAAPGKNAASPNAAGANAAGNPPALSADMRRTIEAQGERLDAMRSQIAAQIAQIDQMKRELAVQESQYLNLRHAVGMDVPASQAVLASQRGTGEGAAGTGAATPAATQPGTAAVQVAASTNQTPSQPVPVGQAPERSSAPPAVAPIFSQPGVLTPGGKFVVEPSYQFGYSSADRVDLIGYTVIPAILIGLIDARQVKTTTQTAALAVRYGITNRLELELRAPYQYNHTDTISREIFTGSAEDRVFSSSGHGLGDIEATARYQINDGGADKPYYIGWLRFKSRTGTDPFEVTTDCVTRCVQNTTGTGLPLQVPTGSGFYSLQPGVTWLLPSDPVVFFGNVSYLYNFARHNVRRHVLQGGTEPLGTVKVGNVVDVSVGMGFALNEKASISLGYDQSFVGTTKQNGHTVAGSARSVLGTLLIGGSYRMSDKRTLNVALGVGVTRDTPDVTLTVRVPITL